MKDRSVPFIRGTTLLFLPSPPLASFRAYADRWPRYRYKPSELFRVPLPRGSLQSIQIDTNRKVAGEWRGGEKFDSLVIRCQVERISMTRNGQCFSTVFFKSCFNETIVKRMWREWRINEGGEGKNRYLIWSRVIDFTKVIFLLIHFASIIDRSYRWDLVQFCSL